MIWGALSDEHGERFDVDISTTEKRYQDKWESQYAGWLLLDTQIDVPQAKYNTASTTLTF